MNRTLYFKYIEKRLNYLAFRIEVCGKLNLLELHIHSETFFADLLNLLLGFNLKNLNAFVPNVEGIDLIDDENKVVAQVSSICSKRKIESSLNKKIYEKYRNYNYKFISISKNAGKSLRNESFKNPYNIKFDPSRDIWDIERILVRIRSESIDKQM